MQPWKHSEYYRGRTPHAVTQTKQLADRAAMNGARPDRERKCVDTIGTVLLHWAGHFQRSRERVCLAR